MSSLQACATAMYSASALERAVLGCFFELQAIAPSASASVRNLASRVERGREGGGMKSHGRRMKSDWMRLEKCRRTVPVPMLLSCDSSKVWTSMRRPVEEELIPVLDFVIINAGALLKISGLAKTYKEGADMARESVLSGKAWSALVEFREQGRQAHIQS